MFSRGIRQELPALILYTEDTRSIILCIFISVYFQSRLKGELIEEKPKMMIKSSNDSFELNNLFFDGLFTLHRFAFVTFETLIVFISLFIVSTSSFVINRITNAHKKKTKRNRSNFAFISLSVFDIAVTLLSVPLDEIYWFYMKDLQFQWFIAVTFFIEFPFSFSCLITVVMAVDRVFAITLVQKYENIVTLKALKVIIIILLLLSVNRNSITFWSMLYILASKFWVFHVGVADLILKVALQLLLYWLIYTY